MTDPSRITPNDSRLTGLLTFVAYHARTLQLQRGMTPDQLTFALSQRLEVVELFDAYDIDIASFAKEWEFVAKASSEEGVWSEP